MAELTRQNLEDILFGAVILGAGGGGDIREGMALIDRCIAAGKTFDLVSVDDVPDDAIICTPYFLGAISPMTPEEELLYGGLPSADQHPMLQAYAEFQEHLGQEFYGTTACELGGSNTAAAFFPAVMNGHKIIDADPAGRAVPEITHSTYYLAGLPAAPIYAVNQFGESFLIDKVKDDQRAEALVRALCQVSRNDIAAIDHALPMRDLREVLIPGTISKAMELGEVWRTSVAGNGYAASDVAKAGNGAVVFTGTATAVTYKTDHGFTVGQIDLAAADGKTMRISVKNENMACWLDDAVFATVPDLICLFDMDSGAPIANPDCHEGQRVGVVILPAPEPFLTRKGLAIFGPNYAGISAHFHSPLVSD
jgi:uncharacterized protein